MNPEEAAGEGLDGPVAAEQGAEAVGESQATRRPQKGTWSLTVAEEHYWDPARAADAARIMAAHPPRNYTVATTIGQPEPVESQPGPSSSEQYARDIECAIGLNAGGAGPDMVHAVRDAVLRVRDQQLAEWRRKAIDRGLALSRLQRDIQALTELAAEEITHGGEWGNGYRDAQRDLLETLTTLQSGH
ncbi:hypothetical protein ACFWFX_28750 [Streptomyces roseolus]|uniref:hypothetical protein n=1 Tax=Streptomyces roseolus TaxID=67358 RepID=UPI003663E13C